MTSKYFTPVRGEVYKISPQSGKFLCTRSGGFMREFSAELRSLRSGWTFTAVNCEIHEDGTIAWAYSYGGHFENKEEHYGNG